MQIEISLKDIESGETLVFPMLPEKINVKAGTRFASYAVMNIGEIRTPLGEELTVFNWEGILPGQSRYQELPAQNFPAWIDPRRIQEKLSYFRAEGRKLHLKVTGTPIDHDVFLESYTAEYAGSHGDYRYTVSFIHAKDLIITTEEPVAAVDGKTDSQAAAYNTGLGEGKQEAQSTRSPETKSNAYTVKSGDTLWQIAQRQWGDGSRYMDIAKANNIADPNKIYPGQTFILP